MKTYGDVRTRKDEDRRLLLKCYFVVPKSGDKMEYTQKKVEDEKKDNRRLRTESTLQIGCATATD